MLFIINVLEYSHPSDRTSRSDGKDYGLTGLSGQTESNA